MFLGIFHVPSFIGASDQLIFQGLFFLTKSVNYWAALWIHKKSSVNPPHSIPAQVGQKIDLIFLFNPCDFQMLIGFLQFLERVLDLAMNSKYCSQTIFF